MKWFYKVLSFAFIFVISPLGSAQDFQWVKKVESNQSYDIVVDKSGISYQAGVKTGFADLNDIFITKYNAGGQCLWNRQWGGQGLDAAISICLDQGGNFLITGYFSDTVSFGSTTLSSTANTDVFIAKLDSSGNCLWAKKIGGFGNEMGFKIKVDINGYIYLVGKFNEDIDFGVVHFTGSTGDDIFLAKFDSQGNCIWAKKGSGTGVDYSDNLVLENGNVIISGTFQNVFTLDNFQVTSYGDDDGFCAKYDSEGNCLWLTHTGGSFEDAVRGISTDSAGNIYMSGYFQDTLKSGLLQLTSLGARDIFLIKYDSSGNSLWAVRAGNFGNDYGFCISSDENGNSYLAGAFYGTSVFDTIQLNNFGSYDIFWAKYNSTGRCLWARHAGGLGQDVPYNLCLDSAKNIYTIATVNGLINSATAYFGNYEVSSNHPVTVIAKLSDDMTLGIKDESSLPQQFVLKQNYPNPFNPTTTIEYQVTRECKILLKVYDMLGKEVAIVTDEVKEPGSYKNSFDASSLSSGVYFYRLQAGEYSASKKMILLR